jgi:hypothetical protein
MEEEESVGLFDFKGDWFFNILITELAKRKPLEEYTGEEVKEITIKVLRGVTPDMAKLILGTLKEGMPDKLKERRAAKAEFEEHIRRVWGKPLDLLEIFLELCLETAILFHENIESHITPENKHLYQALLRLHARGCQVGAEVLTLLNSGFADGAHARWRTLYEITIVAFFISENGNDIAERYIRHDTIESYRAINVYQKCHKRLGYEPCTVEEIAEVTTAFNELCERFGPNFKEKYGWASEALHKEKPRFVDIENATNFDHWRAHYKLASHNIHAEPKGIVFRLGMPTKTPGKIRLLPGPSDAGFTDPAHCTAISLYQLTCALLSIGIKNNPIWGVTTEILGTLEREIGQAFLEIDKQPDNA